MKPSHILFLLVPAFLLVSCGGSDTEVTKPSGTTSSGIYAPHKDDVPPTTPDDQENNFPDSNVVHPDWVNVEPTK